jgi:hypothetical protein
MSAPHLITHKGKTNTIAGWSKEVGIHHAVIYMRLENGWSVTKALTTPVRQRGPNRRPKPPQQPRVLTPSEHDVELKRHYLSMQRQFNSTLRQFNRDLHAIMGRSLDRGVVVDLLESASDRSIPVARGLPEIGNS